MMYDGTLYLFLQPQLIRFEEAAGRGCGSKLQVSHSVDEKSSILASSSRYGTRKFTQLNPEIIGACFSTFNIVYWTATCIYARIEFVQSTHLVTHSILVDNINEKCANYRRKKAKVYYVVTVYPCIIIGSGNDVLRDLNHGKIIINVPNGQ